MTVYRWTQGNQRVSENQTKKLSIPSHKYSTYSSIRLEWIHSSKRMYVSRSCSYRLGVFAVWWSTWISKEKQRTFRQLQHRRKETLIQAHSERSLVIRMDDSWWDAIFGHNEGKVKQSLKVVIYHSLLKCQAPLGTAGKVSCFNFVLISVARKCHIQIFIYLYLFS